MTSPSLPLVSIYNFCKDRKATIERSIQSVLNQSYKNIELVIQDGASTDGTLEIIRKYEAQDSRVKLVSAPDSGPIDAFMKAFRRCEGEVIGSCLSDEELLPGAIEHVMEFMQRFPDAAAVTGDGDITDGRGHVTGEFIAGDFDFVGYLFGRYCPLWAASFFRRSALQEIGIFQPGGGGEFETWCALATRYDVQYTPRKLATYAIHDTQLSNTTRNIIEHVDARLSFINKLFSEDGFFGKNEPLRVACITGQLAQFCDHALSYGLRDVEMALEERRRRELGDAAAQALVSIGYTKIHRIQSQARHDWHKLARILPISMRKHLPRGFKDQTRQVYQSLLMAVRMRRAASAQQRRTDGGSASEPCIDPNYGKDRREYLWVYPEIAALYEARGQIDKAIRYGMRAAELHDADVDSAICQASLKLPGSSEQTIAEFHKRWVMCHVKSSAERPIHSFPAWDGKRKIRIGYHCAFMETPTIHAQMLGVMAAHPRDRFDVYGYSHCVIDSELRAVFTKFRDMTLVDEEEFVKCVREDEIDIFVEMTGFSPQHRFREMARRIAPVQISYLNHAGTCGIAEVDYILTDEIGIPSGWEGERFYSETPYRIPGSFFVFDYERLGAPPVAEPPSRRTGIVTFASFSSGGKINMRLIGWWAEILRRVPGSVFYVRNNQLNLADNRRFMQERFAHFGIDKARLRIEGGTDRQTILKSYDEVDISLDTWPYCGGNSVAEALWQGVPVVTLKGDRFAARYGASLVTAAGLSDLVAISPEQYVDRAVALAGNPERLLDLRRNLRRMYKEYGLGDSQRLARALEHGYERMLLRAQSTGRAEASTALSA